MLKILLFLLVTAHAFANIGTIMALKGSAEIHKKTNTVLTAKSGMAVDEGDTIVTQNKTRVQIILKDDTIITVGSHSSFAFDTYFFDGSKKSTLSMRMNRGFFRSVTGQIGKIAPERFKVKTSSATIGIRGTDFSVKLQNAIERFRCYSGGIRISFGDTYKNIGAGEVFELNINSLRSWIEQSDLKTTNPSDIKGLDVSQLSDLKEIDVADREIIYPRPEPIIPDGIPCLKQ